MPSVIDQTPFNEYVANGVTTVFPYEFELLSSGDLVVRVGGVVVPPSGFVLDGVGAQAGGSVTFGVAPLAGARVLLSREIELTRDIDYQNNGDLRAAVVNRDFNRLWQALQGQGAEIGGAVRAPYPEQIPQMPPASERAAQFLAFDASGDPIAALPAGDIPVSSFMQPVLLSADPAAFAAASGLSSDDAPDAGAGLVGYGQEQDYPPESVGAALAKYLWLEEFTGVDPTGANNSTAGILAAVQAAMASGKELLARGDSVFLFDGFNIAGSYNFSLRGVHGRPTFNVSQSAADAGSRGFRFEPPDADALSFTLAATVKPNQRFAALSSVAGLSVGMMLQISSNTLWYHDNRGEDTKGELHIIRSIDAGLGRVYFEDHTRDNYNPGTETITVRAWAPNRLSLRNLQINLPTPAGSVSTCAIQFSKAHTPVLENISISGATLAGIEMMKCWHASMRGIHTSDCGNGNSNGYGIQDKGSVGTIIDGLYSWGCRRSVDFHGLSGSNGCVSRDWQVSNFILRGGGDYYPDQSASSESYGIGMHGATEGGTVRDGFISDVLYGVNVRGRSVTIDGIDFGGTIAACVSASFGTGLTIRNCTANRGDYPNKLASFGDAYAGSGIGEFVRFGISTSSGPEAMWQFDLPVAIVNNSLAGLTSAFMRFMNDVVARNMSVSGNMVQALPGGSGTFYAYLGHSAAVDIHFANSDIEDPMVVVLDAGAYSPRYSTVLMGYRAGSADRAVRRGAKEFEVFVFDDDVAVIRSAVAAGQRILAGINADASGRGIFALTPENATLTNIGGIAGTIVGTATGSSMTGTSGSDGNVTLGLMNNGDLWVENRGGANRSFRISVLG